MTSTGVPIVEMIENHCNVEPPWALVHAAVYAFARNVAAQRGNVPDHVVRQAHDSGLTDADLLQLVAECVFAGLVGIIDNLAGRVPLDEFLQPQAWKAG